MADTWNQTPFAISQAAQRSAIMMVGKLVFAAGIVAAKIPDYGEFVLAELTQRLTNRMWRTSFR